VTAPLRVRAALATSAGCTLATGLYAVMRVVQALIVTEPDPALVIWSEHAGFFWRAWTVSYVGGMAAFVAWMASARSAPAVTRFIAIGVPVAAALVALQGLFVP